MVISYVKCSHHKAFNGDRCYKPQMQGSGLVLAAMNGSGAVCPLSATVEHLSLCLISVVPSHGLILPQKNKVPFLTSLFLKWISFGNTPKLHLII